MLFWLVAGSLAIASPECSPTDHVGWIEAVRARGEERAYLCLAADDTADAALLEAIAADEDTTAGSHRRMQRALAVHVMQRLDAPVDAVSLRAMNASDRRLLRDAVHARRGRASPVPDHLQVFEKFDWYQPDPRFTNRSLQQVDTENLALIDRPPRAPRVETPDDAPAAMAIPEAPKTGPRPASTEGACGCLAVGGGGSLVWWAGVGLLVARRRRHE